MHQVVVTNREESATISVYDENDVMVKSFEADFVIYTKDTLDYFLGSSFVYDKATGLLDGDYERHVKVVVHNRICDCCESCSMILSVDFTIYIDGNYEVDYDFTDLFPTWGCESEQEAKEALAKTPYACYNELVFC